MTESKQSVWVSSRVAPKVVDHDLVGVSPMTPPGPEIMAMKKQEYITFETLEEIIHLLRERTDHPQRFPIQLCINEITLEPFITVNISLSETRIIEE